MAQTIQECLDYLAAARESVEELSLAADREEQLKQDESRKAIRKPPFQHTDICVPCNGGTSVEAYLSLYNIETFQPEARK